MSLCAWIGWNTVRFKVLWQEPDFERVSQFLDDYFERMADWTHAVRDMGLERRTGKPYERLVVRGDFFWDFGLRMDHFTLDCSGQVILVVMGDGEFSYLPLDDVK